MVTSTSEKLTPFLAGHEGFVSRTYLCPAGKKTIGFGFTMGSKVFAEYWRAKHGRALRMGDTITRSEADAVLTKMLAAEYAPPVDRALPDTATQHAFDGSTSVSYNCGPGALKWKWAQALGRGDVKGAAALLRNTAVTANGRRLAGLVRRRKEEAALIEFGQYGAHGATPPSESKGHMSSVAEYQGWLKTLGYYTGNVDGLGGPLTDGAVKNFQRASGLVVDGKVGPATRAAMIRALDARLTKQTTAGSATVSGGAGTAASTPALDPAGGDPLPLPDASTLGEALVVGGKVAIAVAIVVFLAFLIFRFRGRITGKRVPT